ncbi:MAG: glycosyltransferase [Pseudorhodoplanes sp.]|uniref:glycosyltransferase n=1 Tax=Pseudorhodoplanes sp. TaxID=1934341 RepID=UPI003D0D6A68
MSLHPGMVHQMSFAILALTLFVAISLALHLVSVAVAIRKCRPGGPCLDASPDSPSVSIVLPVCGLDNYLEDTLRSAFRLDYPRYELIFCLARPDDPAAPLVRRLMADHPWIDARLLVGDERISDNPKLNNVFKGWREAVYPFVSICDSNVLLPRDYIQRLLAKFDADTGLVCSPPVGCRPDGFFAEVECAMLNNYQARWQCFADFLGLGFAQGKTLFWRKNDLESAGGIRALGAESAEDAACTKIVRSLGRRVRLMEPPVRQPLGMRRAIDVWNRQRRWARLRRASFPFYFSLEILSGSLAPLAALIAAASLAGLPALPLALGLLAVWYSAEWLLSVKAGWHHSRRSLATFLLRDAMLPVLYVNAWLGRGFEWRGHDMRAAEGARLS